MRQGAPAYNPGMRLGWALILAAGACSSGLKVGLAGRPWYEVRSLHFDLTTNQRDVKLMTTRLEAYRAAAAKSDPSVAR
jgi:hypothetical protein